MVFGWVIITAEVPYLRLLQIVLRLLRLARLNRVLGQIEGVLTAKSTRRWQWLNTSELKNAQNYVFFDGDE